MNKSELLHVGRSPTIPVAKELNPIVAFQDEMNNLFNDFFGETLLPSWFRGGRQPAFGANLAMDVIENAKEFKITAEVPGLDMKDLEITVGDGYVTVKGEKKQETREEKEGYFRQERSYGSFQRMVSLPDTANLEKAEASISKGILTIAVPKKPGAQAHERKLKISSAA